MIDTHTTIKPILKYPGAKSGFQATDYIYTSRGGQRHDFQREGSCDRPHVDAVCKGQRRRLTC